jgi:hypothetical protein
MAYRNQAQFDKAETAQRQALEIFEKLAKEHPDVQEYAYDVGRGYEELAKTTDDAGRSEAALPLLEKAIEILQGALGRGYRAAQPVLLNARIDRAAALIGLGEHVRAAAAAEALACQADLLSAHCYDLCYVFSRASAAVDRDSKLSAAERSRLKARYADRAMEFLRQAISKGFRHPRKVKEDPDLAPLRARKDFQKLLADLEANSPDTK